MSRPYYVTGAMLRETPHTRGWWAHEGLNPLVNPWPELNPFTADAGPLIDPLFKSIGALCPPGWLWFCGCYGQPGTGPLTALTAANWATFRANLVLIGNALRAHGGAGIVLDCEYYPKSHAGVMEKGTWKGNSGRGKGMVTALGPGLIFAAVVWAVDLPKQPGLEAFLKSAWKQAGPARSWFLGEEYADGYKYPHASARARALGAGKVLAGWQPTRIGDKPGKHPADWVWDPQAFWLK